MSKGKQESTNALRRQWTLVRKIPRAPQKKSASQLMAELATEGFRIEKRTVERDLIALSEIFPTIECDERDRPYGWSWAKDAVGLQLPGMTAIEALAFQMIERFLKPLLPGSIVESLAPFLRASRAKLNEPTVSQVASWTKKVRVVHPTQLLIPPRTDPAVQRTVTEGLLRDRQMEILYHRRSKADTVTRVVNPLALVQRGPVTYLVVSQSRDPFYLAMHRIARAGILEAAAQRPPAFDIDKHIAAGQIGFGVGRTIRLEFVVSQDIAEHLSESPLSADQKLDPVDGERTKIIATVPHNQQLEWWLLAFGSQVEVLSPQMLRMRMKKSVERLAQLYG